MKRGERREGLNKDELDPSFLMAFQTRKIVEICVSSRPRGGKRRLIERLKVNDQARKKINLPLRMGRAKNKGDSL